MGAKSVERAPTSGCSWKSSVMPRTLPKRSWGHRPTWWTTVVLAVHILSLTCISRSNAAEIKITIEPPNPHLGTTVTLIPSGKMENLIKCTWQRGSPANYSAILTFWAKDEKVEHGPSYSGRETTKKNCELSIQKLVKSDDADYRIQKVFERNVGENGAIHLEIVVPLDMPETRAALSTLHITLIVVAGTVVGFILVSGLVSYQLYDRREVPEDASRQASEIQTVTEEKQNESERRPSERRQSMRRPSERKQSMRRPSERKQSIRRPSERKQSEV